MFTHVFSFSRVAVTYFGGYRTCIWQLWNLDRCQDELWQEASVEFYIRYRPSLVNLQRSFCVCLVESCVGMLYGMCVNGCSLCMENVAKFISVRATSLSQVTRPGF